MRYDNVVFHINKCLDGLYRKCNSNCVFCAENTDESLSNGLFITIEMLERVIGDLKRQQGIVKNVFFAGGEPTLRHDFPLMISTAKKVSQNIHMTSNGNFDNPVQLANELENKGLSHAAFSLHGHTKAIHEFTTRTPGSFSKILGAIEAFLEVGVRTSINCVVTSVNVKQLPEIVEFVYRSFPSLDSLTFSHYRRHGEACDHDDLMFSALDQKEYISRAIDFSVDSHLSVFFRDFPFCADSRLKNMEMNVKDVYVVLWDEGDYFFCSEDCKKLREGVCSDCIEASCAGLLESITKKLDKYQAWESVGNDR